MARACWHCVWLCPLLASIVVYVFGIALTVTISQPFWYHPYVHNVDTPEDLNDMHFPMMPPLHAAAYPVHTSPLKDFNLGYEQVKIASTEHWINPRTGKQEAMSLRGWAICFHHTHEGKTNRDRVIEMLKESNKTDEMIEESFVRFVDQQQTEGVVGIHGAGMDRRELLR